MKQKPLWLKWLLCLIPLILATLMYFLLPLCTKFTEYVFCRIIFRIFAFPFQWVMSLLPFSFAELLLILSVPTILTLLTVFAITIIKSRQRLKAAEKGLRFTAFMLSLAVLIYMVMHGGNYYRLPLADLMELPNRTYTADDLYTVTCDLAEKASEIRKELPQDKNGCVVFSATQSEILKLADDCFDSINDQYPFLKTAVWRVKPVTLSHYWSYLGTTGVYCPWTNEANINADVPDYSIPHTAAHEIAHTMGIAKEDECNFIAWLACAKSGMPDFEYSGYLAAYTYCSNALYNTDYTLWKNALSHCSEGVLRDLKNENNYWNAFEGEIMQNSQELNDSFIKFNRDENGILSYNLMVELMLRYYDLA